MLIPKSVLNHPPHAFCIHFIILTVQTRPTMKIKYCRITGSFKGTRRHWAYGL